MIKLPLPDRSLIAIPLALLCALLIFILVREKPAESDHAVSSAQSVTDGSGVRAVGFALPDPTNAVLLTTTDAFDYTFVFPTHETPAEDSRHVRLNAGAR
jgi:hypothetical protein